MAFVSGYFFIAYNAEYIEMIFQQETLNRRKLKLIKILRSPLPCYPSNPLPMQYFQ
jgi:hypothetical protein